MSALMLERPRIVPFRWDGHGIDVRTHLEGDTPLFNADDICRALERHVEVGQTDPLTGRRPKTYPSPTRQLEGATDRDGAPMEFFTLDQVTRLAADVPMVLQNDFADWLEQTLESIAEILDQFVDATHHPEPGHLQHASYAVVDAARILSRDPALSYTQPTLFVALEHVGWIHRDEAGIWSPDPEQVRAGHLVRHNRVLPGNRPIYPQIRITPTGLTALHELLGGHATIHPEPEQAPTLLELP